MLHYLTLSKISTIDIPQLEMDDTIKLVQSNLDVLLRTKSMVATAEHCVGIEIHRSLGHILTALNSRFQLLK
jgi:hypothetical protein